MAKQYRQFMIMPRDAASWMCVSIFSNRVVLETRAKGSSVLFYSNKRLIGIVDPRVADVKEYVNDQSIPVKEVEAAQIASKLMAAVEADESKRRSVLREEVKRG